METKTGIRELKAQLSAYLRQVKAGGTVTITDRGKPIARIVPLAQPIETQLEVLQEAGLIAWNGQKLSPMAPVARTQGDRTVADLLKDRE
jgi:prevent-host-death family protein